MQISRRILLACVAASLLVPAILTAEETEAQIKARQALDQKMKDLEKREATPDAVPAVPPPAPKPAAPAATKAAPPAPAAHPKTSVPAAGTVIIEPTGATVVPVAAAKSSSAKSSGKFMDFPMTSSDPAADMKELEALHAKMAALRPMPALPPTEPHPHKEMASNLPPLPTPPSAVTPSKEARLQDLLQQYKMDMLTPEEYHARRAKILVEP